MTIDDPHKPDEAQSDKRRTAVLDSFNSTLLSRLNDPVKGAIVLIQQRVHENDLAGMLLEQGGWVHLDLPAIAEERTFIDLGKGQKLERPVGHLLNPERMPQELSNKRKEELGANTFATQYQQRPAPMGGGIVKWEWFETYETAPEKMEDDQIVQSWDTATTASELSDYSDCTTWLVRSNNAWLIDVYREHMEYPDLKRQIEIQGQRWGANRVIIEYAGSGIQLMQELRRASKLNVISQKPKNDKETRMMAVSPIIEAGRVFIPEDVPWLAKFQREVTLFPKAKNNDQVDSLSQFLTWLKNPPFEWYMASADPEDSHLEPIRRR